MINEDVHDLHAFAFEQYFYYFERDGFSFTYSACE